MLWLQTRIIAYWPLEREVMITDHPSCGGSRTASFNPRTTLCYTKHARNTTCLAGIKEGRGRSCGMGPCRRQVPAIGRESNCASGGNRRHG